MAIDPIIYMNRQALMAGRKPILRDWSGKPVAIGGKPIQRDWSGKPVAIGGQPVLHPPGTPTSDEVGGLPVINGLDGRPNAVVTPTFIPPLLTTSPPPNQSQLGPGHASRSHE